MNSLRFVHATQRRNFRYVTVIGFLLLIGALVIYQAQQQTIIQHEYSLAVAGFIAHSANTPELKATLNLLPAHHVVQRMHADKVRYMYADPDVCDCLYVGSQHAYDLYRQIRRERHLEHQQQVPVPNPPPPGVSMTKMSPAPTSTSAVGPSSRI